MVAGIPTVVRVKRCDRGGSQLALDKRQTRVIPTHLEAMRVMAVLEVVKGMRPGQQFPVRAVRSVLGRHPECDIVLEAGAVSRQHAAIVRESDHYFLEDMGSRNGTFLNGNLIRKREPLTNGDQVTICDLAFKFFFGDDPSGDSGDTAVTRASPLPSIVDDEPGHLSSSSSVTSKVDLSSSRSFQFYSVKPEEKLRAMLEIAQNLGKALSLEEVLSKLLDSLFNVFLQADRGFVILKVPQGTQLVPKAVKYRREDDEQAARISRTVVHEVMDRREAILSADAASDARFEMAQSIADFQIRSMMCAPLIDSDGNALGVIQIDTLDQRSRFDQDDLQVLASVASQAAVAVENAQLHEQAIRQKALERDLRLAHQVQQGLIPATTPEMPGYHFFHFYDAAYQVGGDYYDYIPLADGRLAVVVADVSGKGVAAALLMAKLSGDVRYWFAMEPDPAAAVGQINQTFSRSNWEDRFVTFVAAVLEPAGNQLTIVNAGHMAPLVRRGNGDVTAVAEEQAGLPLGVSDDFSYESAAVCLESGESVTLFTDGISEAMNSGGHLYTIGRLARCIGGAELPVVEMGQHILHDVRHFVGGHPQSDDMCLACFGRVRA